MRTLLLILAEVIVGVMVSGVMLAIVVPLLNHYDLLSFNDLAGTFLIALVMVGTVGAVILRPGSAMNRYFKH